MNQLTLLEVFDRAAEHLLSQGARAEGHDGACKYRAVDGRKCAVGALIPDGLYRSSFEDTNVKSLFELYHYEQLFDFEVTDHPELLEEMLDDLQSLHDLFEPKEWEERLAEERAGLAKAIAIAEVSNAST